MRIETNSNGTLVIVRYVGHITSTIILEHLPEITSLASKISRGFTLFTDLSKVEAMDYGCTSILAKIMDYFSDYGVRLNNC